MDSVLNGREAVALISYFKGREISYHRSIMELIYSLSYVSNDFGGYVPSSSVLGNGTGRVISAYVLETLFVL